MATESPIQSKLVTKPNLMRSEGHTLFDTTVTNTVSKKFGVAQESRRTGLFGNGATGFRMCAQLSLQRRWIY